MMSPGLRDHVHGFGSFGSARWKHWIGHFRNISGQGLEERDNGFHFVFVQLGTQLGRTHNRNRFFQIPDSARVEIRGCQLNVAQRSSAEYILIRGSLGDREAAFVALWQDFGPGLATSPNG